MASKSNYLVRLSICVAVIFLCSNSISAVTSDETEHDYSEVKHVIKPRNIRIYSKPPGEDQERQTGRGFRQHLDNALQGGKVAVEFNLQPLRDRWGVFMDRARSYLPLLYFFKKKPLSDSKDLSTNPPEDSDSDKREEPEVDLRPRLDTSNEGDSENEDEDENEASMEFVLDPRRKPLNPEEIILLEREKLVEV